MIANLLQRRASGSQGLLQRLCSKVQLVMCSPKPRAAMESRKCRKSFGWDRGWLLCSLDNRFSWLGKAACAEYRSAALAQASPGWHPERPVVWMNYVGSSSFSGASVTRHSVVNNNPAMEAAFCKAARVTFLGSTTPALTRSSYSFVATL
jgi:hypothetical protein